MGKVSSIRTLPQSIQDAVDVALKKHVPIKDIVAKLRELGVSSSPSAVGRYKQWFDKYSKNQRELGAVMTALTKEIGPDAAESKAVRALGNMINTLLFRRLMPLAEAEDDDNVEILAPKDFQHIARTLKDVAAAVKIDVDRELKIRAAVKAELAEKAKAAAAQSKSELVRAGLSEDTIRKVEEQILGITR